MTDPTWRLRVLPPARRQLERLPESAAAAVLETLRAVRQNPRRLGRPLTLGLAGQYSAPRGPYRIVYEIDEAVHVVAIRHRHDLLM